MADRSRREALFRILASATPFTFAAAPAEATRMYNWLPTESAPVNFPAHLLRGSLFFADGRSVGVPDRRDVANGWGQRGSTHIVGELRKPVPVRLELCWFSYAEDRFYEGNFALPEPAMAGLFARGIQEDRQTGKPIAFERIIVGMAPEGVVSVWMAAGAEVVEVASFQAAPANLPWERVLDNPSITRPVFVRSVLERRLGADGFARLQKDGVPRGRFQQYRNLYKWQPWVTGSGTPQGIRIRSFNGENAFIGAKGAALPRDRRPVPAALDLDLRSDNGAGTTARITLDETETLAAFQKLGAGATPPQLALHLETSPVGVAVSLRDEKIILPLQRAHVRLTRQ